VRPEIALSEHPGHLDDSPQLDLTPAAPDVGPVAQGAHEIPRLAAELALPLRELPHLDAQLGVGAGARDLELLQLAVDLLERLRDRGYRALERLRGVLQLLGR